MAFSTSDWTQLYQQISDYYHFQTKHYIYATLSDRSVFIPMFIAVLNAKLRTIQT